MNTEFTRKLAALAIAMSINALILGSVAVLFDGKADRQNVALIRTSTPIAASVQI